jgi:hypothetical protein
MQPYLFPYLGYFQLIHAVDRFVLYDDVTYIKQGWVNRNQVCVAGKPLLFTLPLKGASSNTLIRELVVDPGQYRVWRTKFLRTVGQAYARAPHCAEVLALLATTLPEEAEHLAPVLAGGIRAVLQRAGCTTSIVEGATHYHNDHLHGQDRILDICAREGATTYVNAPGGRALYAHAHFQERGVDLRFLKPRLEPYEQGGGPFVPGLSIIDAMMYNDPEQLSTLLTQYSTDA